MREHAFCTGTIHSGITHWGNLVFKLAFITCSFLIIACSCINKVMTVFPPVWIIRLCCCSWWGSRPGWWRSGPGWGRWWRNRWWYTWLNDRALLDPNFVKTIWKGTNCMPNIGEQSRKLVEILRIGDFGQKFPIFRILRSFLKTLSRSS